VVGYGLFEVITGVDESFVRSDGNPDLPAAGYYTPPAPKLAEVCSICGAHLGGKRRVVGLCVACEKRAG